MKYIICPPPVQESISKLNFYYISKQLTFIELLFFLDDFWQMIVEQRIKCMVGIFNEQDLKKMKCPTYWPTNKSPLTLSPL